MSKDRFIVGIYNYCDYWCERCGFTQRCRNFVMGRELEREARDEKPPDDATQKAFWNRLADQLREATVFGKASDWEEGPDIDTWEKPDPAYERRRRAQEEAVEKHPLSVAAHAYMMKADAWLKAADEDMKAVAQELLESAGNQFDNNDYEEQARQIGEMIDVVTWYHTLLAPKIGRALHSLAERSDPEEFGSEVLAESRLEDANGSGKIALAGIERSAAAWVRLREILPHREDEILEMLSILSRLRNGIHAAIPGAKSFVRPGLDESPSGT